MKKKMLNLVIILIIISFLVVCGSKESQAYEILDGGDWKDGTYTEITQGNNGEFEVTVVIKNGKMKNILVGDNKELPERGGIAIKELPPKMIEKQSHEVDIISGATITSNALKDAVERCLEQASVDNKQ